MSDAALTFQQMAWVCVENPEYTIMRFPAGDSDKYILRILGGRCLGKDGVWYAEPQPHERTIEFEALCWFDSFDQVVSAVTESEAEVLTFQ